MSEQLLTRSRNRLRWANAILFLGIVLLIIQMLRWTVWPQPAGSHFSALLWIPKSLAEQRQGMVRGNILDSHGSLLVGSGTRWEVTAAPNWIDERHAARLAGVLAPLVGIPQSELQNTFSSQKPYAHLNRVDYERGEEIRALIAASRHTSQDDPDDIKEIKSLPWEAIRVNAEMIRVYPEGSLAAHLLGFVNVEMKAFYGVEKHCDPQLRGEMSLDLVHAGVPLSEKGWRFEHNASSVGTYDVILTVDRAAQYVVEKELRETIEQFGAESGTIIVLNPKTGGVIASASYPAFESARYGDYPSELWEDPAVSQQYEPGSVFKIITMAAGLNAGVIAPSSSYVDTGCTYLGGRTICNLGGRSYGLSDMQDVLDYSLNLGTVYVNNLLGPDAFYTYMDRFGFGSKTGIDLANEVAGLVRKPGDSNWYQADLGTNSFGQGIAVTPMQLAVATGAIANGGVLMQPHVVQGFITQGMVIEVEKKPVRQVIRTDTARTLTEMMVSAVDRALPVAHVPGYSVAGKTGTADIPGERGYGGYGVISGFVGYLPASDPEFVILIKIDRPEGNRLGGEVAAPAFGRIAQELVLMAGIPPDRPTSH